jgi:type 1 fimbria pilin
LGPAVRAILLSVLVLATAACGAYRFPGGGGGDGTGTVSGQVTAVPCSPVEAAPKTCLVRPVPGIEIDFTGQGGTVSTKTDARGSYSIELVAGTWKVSFPGYARIIGGPLAVAVRAGATVVANYVVDSGIRYPVSKEPSTNPHPPEGVPAPA